MKVVFSMIAEEGHVVLTAREKDLLKVVDEKLNRLIQDRRELIKKFAKKSGVVAQKISDLKSAKGKPFTITKDNPGVAKSADGERAYLCAGFHNQEPEKGCGWVKGSPIKREYDSIRALSGSAGYKHYCYLCNTEIREIQLRQS